MVGGELKGGRGCPRGRAVMEVGDSAINGGWGQRPLATEIGMEMEMTEEELNNTAGLELSEDSPERSKGKVKT